MSTRDLYHDLVKNALRNDGWRVTYDAMPLKGRTVSEATEDWTTQLLAAEKDERKIAVAVNSFIGRSDLAALTQALEQLAGSRARLQAMESDHVLYLAVRQATYHDGFASAEGTLLLARQHIQLLVFAPRTETIVQWVS